jgi:hypothetical protein
MTLPGPSPARLWSRLSSFLAPREPSPVRSAGSQGHTRVLESAGFADVGQLEEAAERRPVAWIFAEAPGLLVTTNLHAPALDGPLAQHNTHYLVGASLRGPGHHDDRLLAMADPYLRWLAPARHADDDFQWLSADQQ